MKSLKKVQEKIEQKGLGKTESEQISVNRSDILNFITEEGRKLCDKFEINETNEEYYLDLFAYFKGYDRKYNPKKGLLICGPVGTGKTLSIQVMQGIFKNFAICDTRYIVRDYFQTKPPTLVIDKYGRCSFRKSPAGIIDKTKPITYCFDDFGLENVNVKSYGNEQNIMEEIILDRYDEFRSRGMITLATTNLTAKMIEDVYGDRVRDRLREMMNYVTLDGESKRH
jgi:DNA replication protein DnaC